MQQTVLLLGGTGRTGRRVLEQLLSRRVRVRAVVRSPQKVPAGAAGDPNLTIVHADLLSLGDDQILAHVRDCGTVVCCLGHVISLRGIFGPPRDLVTRAVTRLCRAVESLQPPEPVKFILMSSVSVNQAGDRDARRGSFEKAVLSVIRGLVPPARDNQRAADFLCGAVGAGDPFVEWVAVRPDTLLEGDVSDYSLHEGIVGSLFAPNSTTIANVAHFMCELATDPKVWGEWACKLPVIVDKRSG